jgi:serine/threonine protein kinase
MNRPTVSSTHRCPRCDHDDANTRPWFLRPRTFRDMELSLLAGVVVYGAEWALLRAGPNRARMCERGPTPDVAKVLDFGLVKRMQGGIEDSLKSAVNTITGTPLFLSPEAIRTPDKVDGRSDRYALGCVGYYVLTGAYVFDAATIIEICGQHVHSEPQSPSSRARARRSGAFGAHHHHGLLGQIVGAAPERCFRPFRGAPRVRGDEPLGCETISPVAGRMPSKVEESAREASSKPSMGPRLRTINIDLRKRASQG